MDANSFTFNPIAQIAVLPRSMASATTVPSTVAARHMRAVKDSSAGYVLKVKVWIIRTC